MNNTWIIYTVITVSYVIVLILYFIRRSKKQEKELQEFIDVAQQQLNSHKQEVKKEAQHRVAKAIQVVKKVQQAAQLFEDQAQEEYNQIIEDAKEERRDIIAKAKAEIEELFKKADADLKAYKADRYKEIERNLVKLVVAVTEKVVQVSLTKKDHKSIIDKALEEIKQERSR